LSVNKEGIFLIAKGNKGKYIKALVKDRNIILKVKEAEKI